MIENPNNPLTNHLIKIVEEILTKNQYLHSMMIGCTANGKFINVNINDIDFHNTTPIIESYIESKTTPPEITEMINIIKTNDIYIVFLIFMATSYKTNNPNISMEELATLDSNTIKQHKDFIKEDIYQITEITKNNVIAYVRPFEIMNNEIKYTEKGSVIKDIEVINPLFTLIQDHLKAIQ